MLIKCKVMQCPYYDNRGFCSKPVVIEIDENGMCNAIWRKGQPRKLQYPLNDENYPKIKEIIVDVEETNIKTIEEKEEQEARDQIE